MQSPSPMVTQKRKGGIQEPHFSEKMGNWNSTLLVSILLSFIQWVLVLGAGLGTNGAVEGAGESHVGGGWKRK